MILRAHAAKNSFVFGNVFWASSVFTKDFDISDFSADLFVHYSLSFVQMVHCSDNWRLAQLYSEQKPKNYAVKLNWKIV